MCVGGQSFIFHHGIGGGGGGGGGQKSKIEIHGGGGGAEKLSPRYRNRILIDIPL